MRLMILAAGMLASAVAAGCQPKPQSEASSCPDGGPTFPVTNTCVSRAGNFMSPDALASLPQPREGCHWAPQETPLSDTEALLYMGAVCKGVAATLSYANGKAVYASGDLAVPGGSPVMEVFSAPDADALAPLREKIAALAAPEQATCRIARYDVPGALADALMIGPSDAVRAAAPKDEPNAFCGAYGLNEDEQSFWLVRGGRAMFLTLGQEAPDIAPDTITIMRKGEDGAWSAAGDPRGKIAECELVVEGKTYLDGVCEVNTGDDGSFQVFGKDYFAYASKLEGGKFNVSWNQAPANTHATALLGEDFVDQSNCVSGAKGKVCRWALGARPKG